MAQTKKVLPERLKVTFEALTGRVRGRGLFGIEEKGDEVAPSEVATEDRAEIDNIDFRFVTVRT